MNVYIVSCHSKCGSYFMPYLRSVTVVADSEAAALDIVRAGDYKFLYPEKEWKVFLLSSDIKLGSVIDEDLSADY